ncbi:hypothetical protein HGRIS_003400 [Hohenbuehelia grisea]|uniref:Uncharacterized protein n=1 Tax=Hohenbuehelia grisea TaxID=104357 RepID=A0ABR3JFI7_9AGAR
MIGHHLLEGKITALSKPVAVLHRRTTSTRATIHNHIHAGGAPPGNAASTSRQAGNTAPQRGLGHQPRAGPRLGEARGGDASAEGGGSVEGKGTGRGKGREVVASEHEPEPLARDALKSKPGTPTNGLLLNGGQPQPQPQPQNPHSHPHTLARTFGEADGGDGDSYPDGVNVGTPAAWDIVAVVKRKILFSKRPMPIVGRRG